MAEACAPATGDAAFPEAEFRRRASALQAQMQAAGCDALLLTGPADIFYLTGFLTRFWESPARPWFLVLPATGDPVAVIPAIGADLMGRTWISRIETWDAPNPDDDGIGLLSALLSGIVPAQGAIGLPMGLETHLRMPLADFMYLSDRLAPRRFVDATAIVQRVREIKSEPEIARIRAACAIADRAFDRVPQFARPGVRLDAVFRAFQIALLEEGADWVAYLAGGAGQGGYGCVISPAGDQVLRAGDILMLDTGAVRAGYFCDFDRNFAIGAPDDTARRAHAALHAVTEDVLATLRPGQRACEVHARVCDGLRAHGMVPGAGRLGHGLGLTLTEWPSLTDRDRTVLREGMVLTLEPGVMLAPGRMLVHEENIVLRAAGPEVLSRRTPADLPVLD